MRAGQIPRLLLSFLFGLNVSFAVTAFRASENGWPFVITAGVLVGVWSVSFWEAQP